MILGLNCMVMFDSIKKKLFAPCCCIFGFLCWSQASSAGISPSYNFQLTLPNLQRSAQHRLFIADATEKRGDDGEPLSGTILLPDDYDLGKNKEKDEDKKEKQCMTVCERWGKDCVINPRTGASKCRRACKEFGKECF